MRRPVSDCHAASLEVADHGIVTYWWCRECGEPCDPAEDTPGTAR